MSLLFAKPGDKSIIKKITGRDETRSFLAKLGFVEGESVTVVSSNNGNMILHIKDSRIAIDDAMAGRIEVSA